MVKRGPVVGTPLPSACTYPSAAEGGWLLNRDHVARTLNIVGSSAAAVEPQTLTCRTAHKLGDGLWRERAPAVDRQTSVNRQPLWVNRQAPGAPVAQWSEAVGVSPRIRSPAFVLQSGGAAQPHHWSG